MYLRIFGVDSKTYLNNKVFRNCYHHGQLTTISGPLSRQQLAYLLTLFCLMNHDDEPDLSLACCMLRILLKTSVTIYMQ